MYVLISEGRILFSGHCCFCYSCCCFVYLIFVYTDVFTSTKIIQRRMIGLSVNRDIDRICKETVVA
jgi:hypothetical protein